MDYTYYGDLLGISGYYKLGSQITHEKLNDFYNTVFHSLSDFCRNNNIDIHMFSDSLLISGSGDDHILSELLKVYTKLLHKGLLLRGAIVKEKLSFEPRINLSNFNKSLPANDTLARAVGLESKYKGSRLIIEPSLANVLLEGVQSWLTADGYIYNPQPVGSHNTSPILRRICPTPDNSAYELLYFWTDSVLGHDTIDYKTKKDQLTEISKFLSADVAEHYKETIRLLTRCESRQRFTEKNI